VGLLSVDCEYLGMRKVKWKVLITRVGWAEYQAGYFKMSTWIPFVWAVVNTLVLILSSFAIYGGL
jgi:hypothetical protein